MATWVVGDVQGCREPLERLLARIDFDPRGDRLWFVGDLVNRGPDSAGVLRLLRGLGDRVQAVLGNHDLHVLAVAEGCREAGNGDTLDALLQAPDRGVLLDWLGRWPFAHREAGRLLVHAGLLPEWSAEEALALSAEVERALRGPRRRALLRALGEPLPRWHPGLTGMARLCCLTAIFTRMRATDGGGRLLEGFTGPPEDLPRGHRPWWAARPRREETVLFGHWAAMGARRGQGWIALDSGCVWGQRLTALRLQDDAWVSVPAAPETPRDPQAPPEPNPHRPAS